MKKTLLSLVCTLIASNAFALEPIQFKGRNYQVTGNKCGIHLESSGNRLFFTNIIPPDLQANASCDTATAPEAFCNGSTVMLTCDSSGECKNSDGQPALYLLPDGNIYFPFTQTKGIYRNSGEYLWCNN